MLSFALAMLCLAEASAMISFDLALLCIAADDVEDKSLIRFASAMLCFASAIICFASAMLCFASAMLCSAAADSADDITIDSNTGAMLCFAVARDGNATFRVSCGDNMKLWSSTAFACISFAFACGSFALACISLNCAASNGWLSSFSY